VRGLALGGLVCAGVVAIARQLPLGSSPAASPPGSTPDGPSRFVIDSSTEPSHADLWLDGVPVGKGSVRRELPRDGMPHELRVTAEGHAPTTLLFVDAPPRAFIALEKLAPPLPAEPVLAPGPLPPRAELAPPPPRPAPAEPAAPRPRRAPTPGITQKERAAPAPEKAAATPPPQRANLPRVQIIEDDTPVVQVIE